MQIEDYIESAKKEIRLMEQETEDEESAALLTYCVQMLGDYLAEIGEFSAENVHMAVVGLFGLLYALERDRATEDTRHVITSLRRIILEHHGNYCENELGVIL